MVVLSDESNQESDHNGSSPSWDDESGFGAQFDDGNAFSDVEDSSTLVSQPRQVSVIVVLNIPVGAWAASFFN